MKITGKTGISGLIIKTIIITLIIFFLKQTYAQEIYPEVITTQPREITPGILNTIERFYEISEKSLEAGYNVTIDTKSAFRTSIGKKDRYIIATNFSQDQIRLIFLGSGKRLFNQPLTANNYVIFKIEDLNLKFTLHASNETHAQVELGLFKQEVPKDVDYFQLFDIKITLAKKTIYTPRGLSAIIEFTNFGEGPSNVRLIYSITDTKGKELFTGIDEKIIETNEVIIKNFNTLDIPYGDYIIKTTIYYGDNQEATSEESFTIKPLPKYQIIKEPLLFVGIIIAGLILVIYFKKKETMKTNPISKF